MDDKLVDLRILDRNIQKGRISRKEYGQFIKALPDMEENAIEIDLDEELLVPGERDEVTLKSAEVSEEDADLD